ncbi:hypothetical protein [Chryseobacterium pennipullorum]|uniref:Uncharacterized protein n=1 Tax=Chryseobacterium pennipullorum TaxID=2258963 RepID=A0A3D9B084_9FLAO|nr:hypothetical protein [Chryseobacterium pennipullorum]REC47050.1 hypothetical protein DRF67_12610 [Chryseobacterium pennipullorum]
MLKEGIKILAELSNGDEHTVSINSGTESPQNNKYVKGALIPKNTFRSLSDSEKEIVFAAKEHAMSFGYNEIIKVISLPESIQNGIKNINLNAVESYEELEKTVAHDDFKVLAKDLMSYVLSKSIHSEIHNLGIQIEPGNEYTTTKQDDQYVGLHIDSWDRQPLSERKKSKNRICFNIGKEARYLYFINIPANQLSTEDSDAPVDEIVTEFLATHPEYPVLRIRINPFEGYIAPTEYIIHDGSTSGNPFKDITFTIRSYFQ